SPPPIWLELRMGHPSPNPRAVGTILSWRIGPPADGGWMVSPATLEAAGRSRIGAGHSFGVGAARRPDAGGSALATMRLDTGSGGDRGVRPTVLIVDDHAGFRESARALLEAEGFTVVGDAADGAAAVAAVARLRPDVVLLDVQLPDVDGFAVAGRLAAGT